jgi:hypothetical protein
MTITTMTAAANTKKAIAATATSTTARRLRKHGREKQRIRQTRILLQRHLHAGLHDSWTYSSTLKTALFRANILTNLSGALTQVSAGKVITIDTLACLSLLSTVYLILYRTCSDPIPPAAVTYSSQPRGRNSFIKLIVLLLFNVK